MLRQSLRKQGTASFELLFSILVVALVWIGGLVAFGRAGGDAVADGSQAETPTLAAP